MDPPAVIIEPPNNNFRCIIKSGGMFYGLTYTGVITLIQLDGDDVNRSKSNALAAKPPVDAWTKAKQAFMNDKQPFHITGVFSFSSNPGGAINKPSDAWTGIQVGEQCASSNCSLIANTGQTFGFDIPAPDPAKVKWWNDVADRPGPYLAILAARLPDANVYKTLKGNVIVANRTWTDAYRLNWSAVGKVVECPVFGGESASYKSDDKEEKSGLLDRLKAKDGRLPDVLYKGQ